MLAPKGDERYVLKDKSNLLWADIDGRCLKSKTGKLPAKRVCGLHAAITIQVHPNIMSIEKTDFERSVTRMLRLTR